MATTATNQRRMSLIFTRDFNQWTNQLVRNMYVYDFPGIWGRGLEDQIVRYTGRSFEWIRYEDDYRKLTDYMVNKDTGDAIFQKETYEKFDKDVDELRRLISVSPDSISDRVEHLRNIKNTFMRMYPCYALCVFVPGVWHDRILHIHGEKAKHVIERVMASREHSEGLLKENDLFMRAWIGPELREKGYPAEYVKLLTVGETDSVVANGTLPPISALNERARGFVYIGDAIHPTDDSHAFFSKRNLVYDEPRAKEETRIHGNVAYAGGVIRGEVQTIFNQLEFPNFKGGRILVTSMTSPEFLPAMKKAAAIVTDEGGISCHAAIVARELKKTCVIGTKIATKVFKDGDIIEVDASKGVVRKL